MPKKSTFVVGIGGPVGSGKTTLLKILSVEMRDEYSIGVVVNDLYDDVDMQYLQDISVLEPRRICSVITGNTKKQIFKQHENLNIDALKRLATRYKDLDLILIEGVGDRMDSRFSDVLVNCFVYVIDATDGERLPLKGGAGITESDLLVINKIDLLDRNTGRLGDLTLNVQKKRGTKIFVLAAMERGLGIDLIATKLKRMIQDWRSERYG